MTIRDALSVASSCEDGNPPDDVEIRRALDRLERAMWTPDVLSAMSLLRAVLGGVVR